MALDASDPVEISATERMDHERSGQVTPSSDRTDDMTVESNLDSMVPFPEVPRSRQTDRVRLDAKPQSESGFDFRKNGDTHDKIDRLLKSEGSVRSLISWPDSVASDDQFKVTENKSAARLAATDSMCDILFSDDDDDDDGDEGENSEVPKTQTSRATSIQELLKGSVLSLMNWPESPASAVQTKSPKNIQSMSESVEEVDLGFQNATNEKLAGTPDTSDLSTKASSSSSGTGSSRELQKVDEDLAFKDFPRHNGKSCVRYGSKSRDLHVKFGCIQIRFYKPCLGDSPSCRDTFPIALDWSYAPQDDVVDIHEHEKEKEAERVDKNVDIDWETGLAKKRNSLLVNKEEEDQTPASRMVDGKTSVKILSRAERYSYLLRIGEYSAEQIAQEERELLKRREMEERRSSFFGLLAVDEASEGQASTKNSNEKSLDTREMQRSSFIGRKLTTLASTLTTSQSSLGATLFGLNSLALSDNASASASAEGDNGTVMLSEDGTIRADQKEGQVLFVTDPSTGEVIIVPV